MSEAPRVDWYPSDWLGGTRKLSAEERGIYIDLLMYFFEEEGALECDYRRLSRAIGISQRKLKTAVKTLVDQGKLEVENGFIINFRAKKELEKRSEMSKKARNSAKKRWSINRQKPNKNNETCDANASAGHMRSHPPGICSSDANHLSTIKEDDDRARARAREDEIPFDEVDEDQVLLDKVAQASGVLVENETKPFEIVRGWQKLGLRSEEIIEVIRTVRTKKKGDPPERLAYFSKAMHDQARRKNLKPVDGGKTDDKRRRGKTARERANEDTVADALDFAADLDRRSGRSD